MVNLSLCTAAAAAMGVEDHICELQMVLAPTAALMVSALMVR